MKVLFINSVCGIGSTGRICTDLPQQLEAEGHKVKIAYGRNGTVPEKFQKYVVRIGSDFDCKMHALITRLFDTHGFGWWCESNDVEAFKNKVTEIVKSDLVTKGSNSRKYMLDNYDVKDSYKIIMKHFGKE